MRMSKIAKSQADAIMEARSAKAPLLFFHNCFKNYGLCEKWIVCLNVQKQNPMWADNWIMEKFVGFYWVKKLI